MAKSLAGSYVFMVFSFWLGSEDEDHVGGERFKTYVIFVSLLVPGALRKHRGQSIRFFPLPPASVVFTCQRQHAKLEVPTYILPRPVSL